MVRHYLVANVVFLGFTDTKEETESDTCVVEQPINHSALFSVSVTGNSFPPECTIHITIGGST